jgi:hypothetical protein
MKKSDARMGVRVRYVGRWQSDVRDLCGTVNSAVQETYDEECVSVLFDNNEERSCFLSSLELLANEAKAEEDPRTPEKQYADSVDALLHEYAEKMRKGFDGGTMAWPYSHLGLLAEFLMDYNNINKP